MNTRIPGKMFAEFESLPTFRALLPTVPEEIQVVRGEWHDEEENGHFVAAHDMEEERAERRSERLMPLLLSVRIATTTCLGMHPLLVIVLPFIQDDLELWFTQDV